MCQIIKIAVFVVFANVINNSAIYLTCDILQAVQLILLECITEIESIIKTLLFTFSLDLFKLDKVSIISSIQDSHIINILFHEIHSLLALLQI